MNDTEKRWATTPQPHGDPRITLDQLRTFIAIADSGNFHQAAKLLHRSQPAVTHKLKQLESILGTTLISRHKGRVMDVTEPGKQFLSAMRDTVRQVDLAVAGLREARREGQVRLGVPPDMFDRMIPAMALARASLSLDLDIPVTVGPSGHLVQEYERQCLDIVLFWVPEPSQLPIPGRALRLEPLCWASNRERVITPGEEMPLATFHNGHIYRQAAIDALRQDGRRWRIACMAADIGTVRAAASAGLGIAALPLHAVQSGLVVLDQRHGLPSLPRMRLCIAVQPHHPLCAQVGEVLAQHMQRAAASQASIARMADPIAP